MNRLGPAASGRVVAIALIAVAVLWMGLVGRAAAGGLTPDEARVLDLTNGSRVAAGLPAVAAAPDLTVVAERHARDMAAQSRLFHTPALTRLLPGWNRLGEIVGMGGASGAWAESVQQAFLASPVHRDIMLSGDYTQVGVGVASNGSRVFITEVFGRGGPPPPRAAVPRASRSRPATPAPPPSMAQPVPTTALPSTPSLPPTTTPTTAAIPPTTTATDPRTFEAAAGWSARTVSSHVAHGRATGGADGWGMTKRTPAQGVAALLAVALLVLGVGCGRQTRVSAPNPAVATTEIPVVNAPAPAASVSKVAPAPAVAATGSDLHTVDSVLTDIDTQLATVDHDLATDEGDPTK